MATFSSLQLPHFRVLKHLLFPPFTAGVVLVPVPPFAAQYQSPGSLSKGLVLNQLSVSHQRTNDLGYNPKPSED